MLTYKSLEIAGLKLLFLEEAYLLAFILWYVPEISVVEYFLLAIE